MAVKTIQVFECDFAGCGVLAPYGRMPENWVWYLHKFDTQAVDPNGRPTGKKVTHSEEHEFCSEKHRDAWIKVHGG